MLINAFKILALVENKQIQEIIIIKAVILLIKCR
jgi:hypothetical protein